MDILGDIEYMVLRLIRKYVFSYNFLCKFGHLIPYYTPTQSQVNAKEITVKYMNYLESVGENINNKTVLELGVGVTNSTCYEMAVMGAKRCYAYEPYAEFNDKLNSKKHFCSIIL